jgi:hypothetical protein
MKIFGRTEVNFYTLISTLDDCLIPGIEPQVPNVKEVRWTPDSVNVAVTKKKFPASAENQTPAVQNMTRHFTE